MFEIKNSLNKEIVKRSNYIFARLIKMSDTRRRFIPSEEEIIHIEEMKPIMYPIYFFSNTHTLVPIESYTSIKEFKQAVMIKLELLISKSPYYSIYEICEKENVVEERFIEDTERVVDIIAVWNREKENHKLNNEEIDFKLYLKIFIYYDFNREDHDTVTLMYVQTNYDVIKSKFDLKKDEAIELAAYQLFINYDSDSEVAEKFISKNYKHYIPGNIINYNVNNVSELVDKVYEKYKTINGLNKTEAKLKYLDLIKNNPLYMAHQFNATVRRVFINIIL